ncbi:MAG: PQQ-binding-like beta-propeller repeat protein [Deltaproteobacteria bacterium]|nr:PQQ-binding-like beta-propeller repeat protein [Deltaproteobacteria bacterium]
MISKAPESGNNIQLQKVLLQTAVVSAIFSLVFLAMLIINGYEQYVSSTDTYSVITGLKQELLQKPDDEALIKQIRELDRDYRSERLRQIDFSGLASLMLLIGAVITIGALKWRAYLNGINPIPCSELRESFKIRRLGQSRLALIVFVCILTATGFIIELETPTEWIAQLQAGISEEPAYASTEELAQNWNRFRGFQGAGVTSLSDIPEKWDATGGEGILWKTPIPLKGFNSPIVWGDRIFLSGANEEKRQVYCFDASTGSILWTGDVPTAPAGNRKFEVMEDTGYAAPTMATDGVRVYAVFATGDLATFDFRGRLLWHKSLGIPVSLYGYASSLEVWKDRILVQFDQAGAEDEKSRMYAFDGATGNIVWEVKRPVPNSWTSPLVVQTGDRYQLITVGDPWVIAYDPEDGKEIWRANCVKGDVGASSILAGDKIIAIAPDLHNVAIGTDGTGDVTATHIAWMNDDVGPTIISPVSDGSRVFFLDTYGTLYVVNIEDGKLVYEHDFNENVNASPTLVDGKLYVLSLEGTMFIGLPGEKEFILEESNAINERCFATPAFMPGRIYIRGEEHLYCIGNGKP